MFSVIVSPEAFRTIIASTLEGYLVPHGRRNANNHQPLETYGASYGYKVQRGDEAVYNVLAADVDSSAYRRNGEVSSKTQACWIKSGFYKRYHPELDYLGTFHSHPYSCGEFKDIEKGYDGLTTPQHAENMRLYRFSGRPHVGIPKNKTEIEAEKDFGMVRDLKECGLSYQVGLVATVFEMSTVVKNPLHGHLDSKSAIRFTYNGTNTGGVTKSFRCWLKAYVFPDDTNKPAKDASVTLSCPSVGLFGNTP